MPYRQIRQRGVGSGRDTPTPWSRNNMVRATFYRGTRVCIWKCQQNTVASEQHPKLYTIIRKGVLLIRIQYNLCKSRICVEHNLVAV